ncbi:metallophosphoesterase [Chryseobacterium sp. 2987]|uniref:metallophosphoesterase n=1 Tax=Chryseobacterium sp. 2987 TaxID=2817767 RepID=UPI0028651BBA|nr:metallophosphoesterase [Chryseobacterium sp. 2987]MDR6919982.1 orotate phosphoribosyltransferase/3',5'-cyclic AMP phosphodiesterase CpdA [Chryseobacterium sp. 2987]
MSSIILHISDLHVSLDTKYDGTIKDHDSYLSATDDENNLLYIERFTKFAKDIIGNSIIYLLITGDITDWGEKTEFSYAKLYLEKIISELNIIKDNILLIPGDHDLNRRSLETQIASKVDSTFEEKNDAKFQNFADFYYDFLGRTFNPNNVIVDNLIIDDVIQIIGINSSHKIDLEQTLGAIHIEQFQKEILSLATPKHLKKILTCHHNITSSHENKKTGQWEPSNRSRFISKLEENNINFILSGNEHTSSLKKAQNDEILVSDSGALSSKKYDSAFKIYEVQINTNILLINKIYALQKSGDFENPYHWDVRDNVRAKQDRELKISSNDHQILDTEIIELVPSTESQPEMVDKPEERIIDHQKENYYNSKFTDALYDKVKELKIFYSGHFHWSETSRAHNWIDVSRLIENKENLNFLKNAIVDVVEKSIGSENLDLIIGLGYEGNILSTKAAIKYNKPYSFLPYSYRHHEHHEFETFLNFENNDKSYENILIVTDVVNDGRTIRKLIGKRQNDFFKNAKKIYVISLFYTGSSKLNVNILNFDFIKDIENYDLENDEIVNNIEFYTVKSLKVEKCPYGADFRSECFIYKDDLSCVNLFYDESKYL